MPGSLVEQVTHELRRDGAGAIVELARIGLGTADQVFDGVEAGFGRHREHRHGLGRGGDRLEILDRVVGQGFVEELVHDYRGVDRHEQRVAIGRGLGGGLRADDSVAAGAIVDDHRLVPVLAHLLPNDAGDDVGRSASRERHDDVNGAVGVVLGGILVCVLGGRRRQRRERQHRDRGDANHGVVPSGAVACRRLFATMLAGFCELSPGHRSGYA